MADLFGDTDPVLEIPAISTCCFGRLKSLPAGCVPVAISIGIPRWYRGLREVSLAPTRAMLKMPRQRYDPLFDAILAKLDPKEVAASLPTGAVLLCWEKPNAECCHRRRVAEWLEQALGIEIPEFSFPRAATPAYADLPWS
jgi:hypothetical protein